LLAFVLIPQVQQYSSKDGESFRFPGVITIGFEQGLLNEAAMLSHALGAQHGLQVNLDEGYQFAEIQLRVNQTTAPESYELEVDEEGAAITGGDAAGVYYGTQTLLQLIQLDGDPSVVGCMIKDAPRFGWRGMHLDVGRHMFAVSDIKKFIDWLGVHKLNRLHWHLTEDQGWRIEIKKYPKLTEIGSVRESTPPYGARWTSDDDEYGGYYTQEEVREVVAYAEQRHIVVMPEIDMPGHMSAAISAYPHLGCDDIFNFNPRVFNLWGIHPYVLSPKEETFAWIEDVLGEVCALFPSKYIHIGGDEAPKAHWKKSAFAQSVIVREGLKDEDELQSYFIKRLEKILDSKGRKLIGWDEIREGGLSPNATMMLWRGWDYAIDSINEGHDVVMAPSSHTYFDHYQNEAEKELAKGDDHECIGGYQPIENVYALDPVPDVFKGTAKEAHVLGCQAQLWSEYMHTWEKVEYCAFPRIAALAEVAWTQPERKDYRDFCERLQPMLQRYKRAGVNFFQG